MMFYSLFIKKVGLTNEICEGIIIEITVKVSNPAPLGWQSDVLTTIPNWWSYNIYIPSI